jgi:integrase
MIARGVNPGDELAAVQAAPRAAVTFADAARAYQRSRVDVAPNTTKAIASHVRHLCAVFGTQLVADVAPGTVQTWIAGSRAKPSSIRLYVSTLRAIFDHAGVEPNPARDSRVRLPRQERVEIEPPSATDVQAIIAEIAPRYRLPIRTMVSTGLRVSEVVALTWGDVDLAGGRFRIPRGKTRAARRWVPIPQELLQEIVTAFPPDERTPDQAVFARLNDGALRQAMTRACQRAGTAHYSPHDLRHRYASVAIREGVPITQVASAGGWADKAVLLNTYAHALPDE